MKTNWKKVFTFWSLLLIVISSLFIIQTSFLPTVLYKYSLIPQLTFPLIIYFFSQKKLLSSILLTFFVSLISYSFSEIPVSHFLISYFTFCVLTQISYKLYYGNKKYLFLALLFIASFLFPMLTKLLSDISSTNFYFSPNLIGLFFNASITVFLGFFIYPFLQKYINEKAQI